MQIRDFQLVGQKELGSKDPPVGPGQSPGGGRG